MRSRDERSPLHAPRFILRRVPRRNCISWMIVFAGNSIQGWLQQVHAILNGSLIAERESLPSYTQQNMTRHNHHRHFCHHRDHPWDDEPGPTHADSPILLPALRWISRGSSWRDRSFDTFDTEIGWNRNGTVVKLAPSTSNFQIISSKNNIERRLK